MKKHIPYIVLAGVLTAFVACGPKDGNGSRSRLTGQTKTADKLGLMALKVSAPGVDAVNNQILIPKPQDTQEFNFKVDTSKDGSLQLGAITDNSIGCTNDKKPDVTFEYLVGTSNATKMDANTSAPITKDSDSKLRVTIKNLFSCSKIDFNFAMTYRGPDGRTTTPTGTADTTKPVDKTAEIAAKFVPALKVVVGNDDMLDFRTLVKKLAPKVTTKTESLIDTSTYRFVTSDASLSFVCVVGVKANMIASSTCGLGFAAPGTYANGNIVRAGAVEINNNDDAVKILGALTPAANGDLGLQAKETVNGTAQKRFEITCTGNKDKAKCTITGVADAANPAAPSADGAATAHGAATSGPAAADAH